MLCSVASGLNVAFCLHRIQFCHSGMLGWAGSSRVSFAPKPKATPKARPSVAQADLARVVASLPAQPRLDGDRSRSPDRRAAPGLRSDAPGRREDPIFLAVCRQEPLVLVIFASRVPGAATHPSRSASQAIDLRHTSSAHSRPASLAALLNDAVRRSDLCGTSLEGRWGACAPHASCPTSCTQAYRVFPLGSH